jgi:endonuclease/exonuclease/phosphatase family metal-dependent hydrolase
MAIYNINGTEVQSAYSVGGAALSAAFSIDSEQVFPTSSILRVMTYNVQWFSGINSQVQMQREIIDNNAPDIISFQEFSQTPSVPSVGAQVLGAYPYIQISNHTNYMAIASKLPLSDVTTADFISQDPEELSRWGETRAYIKCYFTFGGKRICFIDTHLCVLSYAVRAAQAEELLEMVSNEERFIIAADLNANYSNFQDEDWTGISKRFYDAGYNLFNSTPDLGIVKTWTDATTATSLSEFTANPDNIITSSNIGISARTFDTTKLRYLNGDPIDHVASCALLLI